jgi:hypothetical protein
MRYRHFVIALLAAAATSAGATAAAPRLTPASAFGVRRHPDAKACNQSQAGTFDPDPNGDDVTGAADSGVLTGYGNDACDDADAIAGGFFNTIAGNGFAADAFIGAGGSILIDNGTGSASPNAFDGGGENNTIAVGNSAAVAGSGIAVQAGQAFDGAGTNNAAGGGYAATFAGSGNSTTGYTSFIGAGYRASTVGDGAFVGGGGYQYEQGVAQRPSGAPGEDAVVGSGDANAAAGLQSFVGAGVTGTASGADAFLGAGDGDLVSAAYAFGGAGLANAASGNVAFAGAGFGNSAGAFGSFVGAGGYLFFSNASLGGNSVAPAGVDSFVGAGDGNQIGSSAAFVGGGIDNRVPGASTVFGHEGDAAFAAIAGGKGNSIAATGGRSARYAFIGGGAKNALGGPYTVATGGSTNAATGAYATVPGGALNAASGAGSFVAGTGSSAPFGGSFVWSDDATSAKPLQSSASNQFLVRAAGGVTFASDPALTSGVRLPPGGGAWASLSDRRMKSSIVAVDDRAILGKVAELPVGTWSYRSENPRVRHAGPMAQDFYVAFGVGEDDRHIATIDEGGVALAAIRSLHAQSRAALRDAGDLARGITRLQSWDDARFAALQRRVARLKRELASSR